MIVVIGNQLRAFFGGSWKLKMRNAKGLETQNQPPATGTLTSILGIMSAMRFTS
jgi:hypothetical protein